MWTLLSEERNLKFSKLKPEYSGLNFFQKFLLYAISVISVIINLIKITARKKKVKNTSFTVDYRVNEIRNFNQELKQEINNSSQLITVLFL